MKTLKGKVISDKAQKTATVLIERTIKHPLYGKFLRRSRGIHADNQIGAKEGDLVEMVETKPSSKTKAFKITKIINLKEKPNDKK